MKRTLCALLLATLPFGGILAEAAVENAKVSLVYERELPNAPGKSLKGVLDLNTGGFPGHTPSPIRLHLCDRS